MPSATQRVLLGLGLMLPGLAFGCGGKAATQESEPAYNVPAAPPPYRAPGTPPRRGPAPPALSPPPSAPVPGMAPAPQPDRGGRDIGYFLEDAVVNVLLANCGQCHGPDAPVEGSGGIQSIGDLDQLVAAGLIIPLSSATSPIVIAMVDGSMPPVSSGLPPVTQADIDTVSRYIDDPRYWPGVTPAVPPPDVSPPDVSPVPPPDVPPAVPPPAGVEGVADAGATAAPTPAPVVDAGVAAEPEPPPVVGASDAGTDPAE